MRNRKLWAAFAELTVLAMSVIWAPPAGAQAKGVKAKPPMYSYIAVWNIPREQWETRENQAAAARKILDRASSDGTIVAYGFDGNPLHDTFWLAMSRAKLQSVRDQFQKAGIVGLPALGGTAAPPVSILV